MQTASLRRPTHFIEKCPRWVIAVLLLSLCLLIGWLDKLSGWEWSLFIFYAIPISLAVWWGGARAGYVLAVVCAVIWWMANHEENPYQTHWGYSLALVSRFAYFCIAAACAAVIRSKQESDAARIETLEELRQLEQDIVSVSEYEQQRIGQDLHDGLCQQLAAIGCAARALADDLSARSLVEARDAENIELELQATVVEARSLARGIYPIHVDRTGLSTALNELAETTSRMTGVPIDVSEWSEVHVEDADVAMHLYRIAQEAVSNALKHSGADEVAIGLRAMGDMLELRIEDNGKGLAWPPARGASGMGLRTMRYRARALGAELEFEPRPGGGTAVVCSLKVRTSHEAYRHLHA
jgi:signal transduction histidine kinase